MDTLISAQAGLVLSAVDLNIPYQSVQSRPRGPYNDVPQMQASNLKVGIEDIRVGHGVSSIMVPIGAEFVSIRPP